VEGAEDSISWLREGFGWTERVVNLTALDACGIALRGTATLLHAGPDILIMAIAARPGAVDSA